MHVDLRQPMALKEVLVNDVLIRCATYYVASQLFV